MIVILHKPYRKLSHINLLLFHERQIKS